MTEVPSNRLKDRVAIVTGSAGRIGAATARQLAREGARVMVADLREDAANALAAAIGPAAAACQVDVGDSASVEAMVEATVRRFGRLDILHNNAALMGAKDRTAIDTDFEVWDRAMQVSLRSCFAAIKFALPHMIAGGGGSIINTTSCAAFAGDNARIAYSTAKAGILGLTQSVAVQHGHQSVRCNAIAPGLITDEAMEREMPEYIAMFRRHVAVPWHGRGEDIAAMVAFLASDEARYITGECFRIDGGYLARQPIASDLFDAAARR